MSTASIVEVITRDNAKTLDDVTIQSISGHNEGGTFVWGISYKLKGQSEIWVEFVYRGRATNRLYLVRGSQEYVTQIERGASLYGVDEGKLEFFKSPEDYLKFFEALNRQFTEGKIAERDYAVLLDKFSSLYSGLPSLSLGQAIALLHYVPNPRGVKLQESRQSLSRFPLVQRICAETGVSLL